MALYENATKIANLIDPEVLADYADSKLIDSIKFSPLAVVNDTLEGRAGSTLTIPTYSFIGMAEDVPEGEDVPIKQLSSSTTDVKVKKAGIGVQLTDEAVLYSYGNPMDEAADQIIAAMAEKIETDHISDLKGISGEMVYSNTGKLTSTAIIQAQVKFGEDIDEGSAVIFVDPQQRADLITEESWVTVTDMGVDVLMRGVVGMIGGCQVVVTNRLNGKENYIVKSGGLGLLLKRGMQVEADRDIVNKSTVITADKHYATYIANESKIIRITNAG